MKKTVLYAITGALLLCAATLTTGCSSQKNSQVSRENLSNIIREKVASQDFAIMLHSFEYAGSNDLGFGFYMKIDGNHMWAELPDPTVSRRDFDVDWSPRVLRDKEITNYRASTEEDGTINVKFDVYVFEISNTLLYDMDIYPNGRCVFTVDLKTPRIGIRTSTFRGIIQL